MNLAGLALCSRYAYPPNSLSLCGPDKKSKQTDLKFYASSQKTDKGTMEILSQFSTLYPYLKLIASENKIADPFDPKVVEAYWLGNKLLHQISIRSFANHLRETINLKKILKRSDLEKILKKMQFQALPNHAFHVTNVYKRTGYFDDPHTVKTMDACLINWGQVKKISKGYLTVETKPLKIIGDKLSFGESVERKLIPQGEKDTLFAKIVVGDFVSYHWGYLCQKLTNQQVRNIIYYTNISLSLANYH